VAGNLDEVTDNNFQAEVLEADKPVLVDFWAPWCGPCRGFGPVFEAASEQHTDVVFGKVNTDEEQELAQGFGIRSIPTLMVLRDKVILYSEAGALSAGQLGSILERAKALDMQNVHRELAEQAEAEKGPDSKT